MKISKKIFIISVLLALATVTCTRIPDKTKYGDNVKAGKYVMIRGYRTYYETYGTGMPMLLIHGNGGSIASFKNQIPYFSKDYHVIAVDSRSQGRSIDDNDSLSFEMMADDLNGLLDTLHVDSCYVLGWSDGGINGLLLAMRHPGRVKKLAVTGANLWPDSTAIEPGSVREDMEEYNSLKDKTLTSSAKHDFKLLRLDCVEPHITTGQLNKITCPVLVIGGDHDLIRPAHTMLIAQSIAESYLWILPNSGHVTLIEHKDLFNATVSDFFKKPYHSRL
jgi:pimeloyl-ACP methyl ester carboxylesterase